MTGCVGGGRGLSTRFFPVFYRAVRNPFLCICFISFLFSFSLSQQVLIPLIASIHLSTGYYIPPFLIDKSNTSKAMLFLYI